MNASPGWQAAAEFFERHWVSGVFLLVSLLTVVLLCSLRWWVRRRWRQVLEAEYELEEDSSDFTPSSVQDQQALDLIRGFRREVWQLPDHELHLSFEGLSARAVSIVRAIAAVYHPHAEVPHYQASMAEMLQLMRRVTIRLVRLGTLGPFKLLTHRKVSDYQKFYRIYRKFNESPLLQLLKRNRYLYRIAKWAVNLKNLGNPLYWAGREISRESYFFLLRWFTAAFAGQVGREAMRLYGGRHPQMDENREAALVCFRLFHLARSWHGPSPAEWEILVDFVAGLPGLDDEVKVQLLRRCARGRLPGELEGLALETKLARKWYERGLKRLLEAKLETGANRRACIERELRALDGGAAGSQGG